jgi:hypothetical protein
MGSTTLMGVTISLIAYFYMQSIHPVFAQSFLFDTLVAIQIWVFADEWVSQGRHKITPFFLSVVVGMFAFHYVVMQDYPFSSPSLAASIVLGMSANGRDQWKDTDGRTLKELQEQGLI